MNLRMSVLLAIAALLSACASTGNTNTKPDTDEEKYYVTGSFIPKKSPVAPGTESLTGQQAQDFVRSTPTVAPSGVGH